MTEAGVQKRRREDPREPGQRARVDAVARESLAVDLVDDLDDPHHGDQHTDHGGALEQCGAAGGLHNAQCDAFCGVLPSIDRPTAVDSLACSACWRSRPVAASAARCRRPRAPPARSRCSELAHHPEVYADASVHDRRHRRARARGPQAAVRAAKAATARESCSSRARSAAADLGRRVRVSGLFTVTFELGYEILVSRIAAA